MKSSPRNIQIFHALAVDQRPIEEMCRELEITRSNADTLKKRVKDQLAEILLEIEEGDLSTRHLTDVHGHILHDILA